MKKLEIHKNYLSKKDFKNISELVVSNYFPYYYQDYQVKLKKHPEQQYFSHTVMMDGKMNSNYYEKLIIPFAVKLNIKDLIQVGINFTVNQNKAVISDWHTDAINEFKKRKIKKGKTAIYYVNTNNGFTEFKTGEKVNSIANQFVIFDKDLKHRAIQQTDTKYRIVINFNYTEK